MKFTKNNIDRALQLTIFIILVDSNVLQTLHHTWAKREEKNKEMTKHILAYSKTRRSPIQKSTTGPTHLGGKHQAQHRAHRPEQGEGGST
jgi:hypothetical protein